MAHIWKVVPIYTGGKLLKGDYNCGQGEMGRKTALANKAYLETGIFTRLLVQPLDQVLSNVAYNTIPYWVIRKEAATEENEFGRVSP